MLSSTIGDYQWSSFQHALNILLKDFPKFLTLSIDPLFLLPIVPLRPGNSATIPQLPIRCLRIDHNRVAFILDANQIMARRDVNLLLLVAFSDLYQSFELLLG